jgi:hypothetical protein
VQLPNGRIVFCAWGNNSTKTSREKGWAQAINFANMLIFSDDYGETWQATEPIGARGWNECFVALLADTSDAYSLLEISRRVPQDDTVPPRLGYPPGTYGAVRFGADLKKRSHIATLDRAVQTPVCEGSLASHGTALFFSHPQSKTARTNLTVHSSRDGGLSWPVAVNVWPPEGEGAGYSSLLPGATGLGIAFNQWPTTDPDKAKDGPGQTVRFRRIPWASFDAASP